MRTYRSLWLAAILCVALCLAGSAVAQVQFTDVTAEMNLANEGASYSVAFNDFSGDGQPDLLIGNGDGPNTLWRNDGALFTEVGQQSGISDERIGANTWSGSSVIQGDYDNDGDLDIFVAVDGVPPEPDFLPTRSFLYQNNGDGTFTDVTEAAGVSALDTGSYGAVFADYDADGNLDIYVVNLGGTNILYRNNGDGTFSDTVEQVGVEAGLEAEGAGLAAIFFDADNDGDQDLYAVNQFGPLSFFYENQGDGTFRDRSDQAAIADPGDPTGVTVGDYDNDGYLDIFVANWFLPGVLYQNNGDLTFTEVAQEAGVAVEDDCRGTVFLDYDNDGHLDLLITKKGAPLLFRNRGNGKFMDVSADVGLTDEMGGSMVAVADYDQDGDMDVYFANTGRPFTSADVLYRNDGGNDNHWIQVQIRSQVHVDGIGSFVQVVAAGETHAAQVLGGLGTAQNSGLIHFGLGDAAQIDRLEVTFPDGHVVLLEQPVDANQVLVVTEEGVDGFVPSAVEPANKRPMLLADVKRSALWQNYPNPFNPETWFPYELGYDADVQVRIYNTLGQMVREIDLGQRQAGDYRSQDRAAYWDGKDEAGRPVSSGVYFYQLRAGDFSQTRRMVIRK